MMENGRRSPVPLYFQLSSYLEDQIKSGALAPGTQLPSEKQLARDNEVSLITVRAAMRVLLDKRLVVRFPGKGTFVSENRRETRTWAIGSLDDLVATGLQSTMKLLWRRKVTPPERIAEKLGVAPQQKVYALRTLREAQGEPFMLTDTYHPPAIANRLKETDFTDERACYKLVISIVEEKCGVRVGRARQTMRMERATHDVNRLLGVEPAEPLLVVEREYIDESGELIEVAVARYRTDQYSYVIDLSSVEESERKFTILDIPRQRRTTA